MTRTELARFALAGGALAKLEAAAEVLESVNGAELETVPAAGLAGRLSLETVRRAVREIATAQRVVIAGMLDEAVTR